MQSNKPFSKLDPPTQPVSSKDLMMISQETPEGWKSGKVALGDFLDQVFGEGGPGYGKLEEFGDRLESLEDRVTTLEEAASVKELAELIFHVGSKHMTDKMDWNPGRDLMGILGYETTWLLYPYIPAGVVSENAQLGDLVSIASGGTGANVNARRMRIWERLGDGESSNQLRLLVNRAQVNEGDAVVYTLITAGLNAGTRIKYTFTGIDKLDIEQPLTGEFITADDGTATLTVLTITDRRTDGDKIMTLTLDDYSSVSANVKIFDTSQAPAGLTVIAEGSTDTIILGPRQQAEIWVIAGGGGGGGSVYSPAYIAPDGTDGTESFITVSDKLIRANGGKKGTGGVWGNGSPYTDGVAGKGGTAEVIDTSTEAIDGVEIQFTQIQKGLDAIIGSRWETQLGAMGSLDHFGVRKGNGGDGAYGVGDEGWSYGGGGGAGGFIKLIVKNRSQDDIEIHATAGTGGAGWSQGGNPGLNGLGGIVQAMITSLPTGDDGSLEFIYPTEDEVDLVVNDYEVAEIWVIGAGGGGGGQANSTSNVNTGTIGGTAGDKSYLSISGVTLESGGGYGGSGGLVGMGGGANGLSGAVVVNGPAGSNSYNENLLGSDITAVMSSQTNGNQRNRTSPVAQQKGADAVTIGTIGAYGKGGDGSIGNGTLHTGGAGGSGSYFKYTVTNRTSTIRTMKAKAGRGGTAGAGQTSLDYMQGLPGDPGLIVIRRSPLVNYENQIIGRDTVEKMVYVPAGKLVAFGLVGGGGGSGGINNTGINVATNDGANGGDTTFTKWGITYKAEGGKGGLSAQWSGSSDTVNPSTPTEGGIVYVNTSPAVPTIPTNPSVVTSEFELNLYSAVKGGDSGFNSSSPGGVARRIIRDTTYGDGAAGILRDIILANPTNLQSAGGGASGSARGFVYNSTQELLDIPVTVGRGGSGALNNGTSNDGVHYGVNAKDGVVHAGVVDYLLPQKRRHNSNIRDLFIPPNRALRIRMIAGGGAGSAYRINPTNADPRTAASGKDTWVRLNGLTYTAKGGKGGTETIYTEADGVVVGAGGAGGVVEINGVPLVDNTIVPNPEVTLPPGVTFVMNVAQEGASGTIAETNSGAVGRTLNGEVFSFGGDGVSIKDETAPWAGENALIGGGGGAGAYLECMIVNNGNTFIAVEASTGRGLAGLSSEGSDTNVTAGTAGDGYITATLEDAPEDGTHFYMTVAQSSALPTNEGANYTVRGYSKNSNGSPIGTYDNRKLIINEAPMEVLFAGLLSTSTQNPAFQIGLKDWYYSSFAKFNVEIENMNNGYRIKTTNKLAFGYGTDFSGSENGTSTKETLRGWSAATPSYTWDSVDEIVSKVFTLGHRLKVKILDVETGNTHGSFLASTRVSDSDSAAITGNVIDGETVYAIMKLPTDVKNKRFKVEVFHAEPDGSKGDVVEATQEYTGVGRMVFPFVAVAPVDGYRDTYFIWSVYNETVDKWYEVGSSSCTVYA